jgi:hypothetical protein
MPKADHYADLYANLAEVYADEEDLEPPPANALDDEFSGGERSQHCNRCRHYFISHEQSFPYGCRALGFKSRREPIREVLDASHSHCLYYEEKSRR